MTWQIKFYGLVQGVGFRPYILKIAKENNYTGDVKNISGIVKVRINCEKVDDYLEIVKKDLPNGALIERIHAHIIPDMEFEDFRIIRSDKFLEDELLFLPADIATCPDCESELKNSSNRRYGHPFISCAVCGPRYSIISEIPYDRHRTTMSSFELCDACLKEYSESVDRRCYAQTIACPDCGPKLSMSIQQAVKLIKRGRVVAIKDIGGYHFACDANNMTAMERLRTIKNREQKPFAVMFSKVEEIEEYATVNSLEEMLLLSPIRPIVLLEKKKNFVGSVCDDSKYLGAMLPCNPVQIMLTEQVGAPLVMTSGNISGEPIIIDDKAMYQLADQLDFDVLSHNREILTPLDDSIVKVIMGEPVVVRRARGYTPAPIDVKNIFDKKIFAAGGDLKASFAIAYGNKIILSQHFGDLENDGARQSFSDNIKRFSDIYNFQPDIKVCDLHPGYFSTSFGEIGVQHHLAHIASVACENDIEGSYTGFAFDGTGYGVDGAIWGGEVLSVSGNKAYRKYHLEYMKMPATDEAAKDARLLSEYYMTQCGIEKNNIIEAAIAHNVNAVESSSMGRLFDVVSAIIGICQYNNYEGECATRLEGAIGSKSELKLYFEIKDDKILIKKLIHDVYSAAKNGVPVSEISKAFHDAIIELMLELCALCGNETVLISGGVFMNQYIVENFYKKATKNGYKVFYNKKVPTGDGGISLGQLWVVDKEIELCV